MFQLNKVRFAYGESLALDDLSFTIKKGDALALMGSNGSGKTTLMKLLVGLIVADSGEYLYAGQRVDKRALNNRVFAKNLHQRIGFLFQNSDAQLFCPTVSEEIAFGPQQLGLTKTQIDERVNDCSVLLGIEPLLMKPPYHLSEGEKRKVALAAVLSLNPEVLVMDEPLNSLDPKTKRFLRDLLIRLNSAGKTIIASTHDFTYLDGLFKSAIVLSADHRLASIGPYEKIIADQVFLAAHNIV